MEDQVTSVSGMLVKAPTGITGLDDITFGGLPAGRPTLICGSAGCGKTLFGVTFLVNGATLYNEPGVFVSFEERAKDLATNVASLGYDLDRLAAEEKLAIDHIRVERSEIEESGEYDLEGLFIRLGFAIDCDRRQAHRPRLHRDIVLRPRQCGTASLGTAAAVRLA